MVIKKKKRNKYAKCILYGLKELQYSLTAVGTLLLFLFSVHDCR